MICPSMQVSFSGKKIVLLLAYCPWLCGRLSQGLSTLGDRKPVPGYWHKMVSCSHFEYPICDCVHSYSISPCQMPLRNISLWQREQSSGLQGTYKNCVHRGTQCPLLCPSTRWRPQLVVEHRHRARILAWVLEKRVCSYQCLANTVIGHRVQAPSVNAALFCQPAPEAFRYSSGDGAKKSARKNHSKEFSDFFLRSGTKQTVFTVPFLFFLFRRALSSCCLQQTCPCKNPVSMFIVVCNTSFWLQLFKGWITLSKNLFPLDNAIVSCHNTYPLDSDLSIGQHYPNV